MILSTHIGEMDISPTSLPRFRELHEMALRGNEQPLAGSFMHFANWDELMSTDLFRTFVIETIARKIERLGSGHHSVEVDIGTPIGWATVASVEKLSQVCTHISKSWLRSLTPYTERLPIGKSNQRGLFVRDRLIPAPATTLVTAFFTATRSSDGVWTVWLNTVRPGPDLGPLSQLDQRSLDYGHPLFFDWNHPGEPIAA